MTRKKANRFLAAVALAAVVGGGIYLDSLMPIITGYAAKNLASAVFVSGREAKEVEALDLNFSLIRFTENTVDYAHKTVTSKWLWGASTAAYREGYGVTLLQGEPDSTPYPLPPDTATSAPLPQGDSAFSAHMEPIGRALVDERSYGGHPFAFVVLHKGGVVCERYDKGISAHTRLLGWSMAKSFVNALTGIMAGDSMVDIRAPVAIAEWQGDERKAITLNDLMQMQSGLEWNEDYGSHSDVNVMLHCEADMGRFALEKPLAYPPGTHWYYSSGTTNIVVRYLRSLFDSDRAFLAYMRERLFAPLGIHDAVFEPDMSGTPVGSSYLYATAMDFARFGQLFLDNGCAGGRRILPEGWVDYSRTPASQSEGRYGAFFWLNKCRKLPDVPDDMYWCDGHDGQCIYIIPSRQLVVVVLGYSPKPDNLINWNTLLRDILKIES
ncbi:MAG: beta-lactamase family protein [Prevotella sp.]|nr:beta-lactamase family protein [Prevotella sp.]